MFGWISRHPVYAALTIGAGTVAASEVIWFLIKYVRNKIKYEKSQIHEVLIFNELGYTCFAAHRLYIKDCNNTHCAQRNIDRIVQLINQAKYSIDLAIFSLSFPEMLNALRQALLRHVKVRIIIHPKTYSLSPDVAILSQKGARIRIACSTRKMMHHKFCVIDGRKRIDNLMQLQVILFEPYITWPVAINGSANWTSSSMGGNYENIIISTNKIIVTKLETEFERMWKIFQSR
ncbi:mitochondrial cardiolipin hydrolase-like [Drosophila innubila]|uniref:mitochondrial cardiolipin hydrolase-like n=1 Tax=Drosophila innubila TaxID=198719 RepID=UPI00148D4450|nr:mitochondrial cardiolipin hydrolase-like [Drosophila innubila]